MGRSWHYTALGERHGPVTDRELKALAENKQLLPDDLVWAEGLPDWMPAKRVKGLFAQEPEKPPPLRGRREDDAPKQLDQRQHRREHGKPAYNWEPWRRALCVVFILIGGISVFGSIAESRHQKGLGRGDPGVEAWEILVPLCCFGLASWLRLGFPTPPRTTLRGRLANLSPVEGKTRAEIVEVLGKPKVTERTPDGEVLLTWSSSTYTAILAFRGDVCHRIAKEIENEKKDDPGGGFFFAFWGDG
jgi:hypothetical protein